MNASPEAALWARAPLLPAAKPTRLVALSVLDTGWWVLLSGRTERLEARELGGHVGAHDFWWVLGGWAGSLLSGSATRESFRHLLLAEHHLLALRIPTLVVHPWAETGSPSCS